LDCFACVIHFLLIIQGKVGESLAVPGDAYINAIPLKLDLIARKPSVAWVYALPASDVELPFVARAGQDVLFQISIGKECPLVRTATVVGADCSAIEINQENLVSLNLNTEHVSTPQIIESSDLDPF
jgi:hypothetical protein